MSSRLLSRLSRPALRVTNLLRPQTRGIIIYEKPNPDDRLKAPDGLWWHPTFAAMRQQGYSAEEINAVFDEIKKDNEKLAAQHGRKESEQRAKRRATKEREEMEEDIYEEKKAAVVGGA
ncbi:hypothetical protein FKW77_000421 [Venturia effusa]|uniref:Uncharacterized protein n=1 Tax=Venturia effusa TaxID=50376 RepID=A0A517LHW6_9PEZI|nr:hypothetical protein FKW77_000421 [Venturia effusa]